MRSSLAALAVLALAVATLALPAHAAAEDGDGVDDVAPLEITDVAVRPAWESATVTGVTADAFDLYSSSDVTTLLVHDESAHATKALTLKSGQGAWHESATLEAAIVERYERDAADMAEWGAEDGADYGYKLSLEAASCLTDVAFGCVNGTVYAAGYVPDYEDTSEFNWDVYDPATQGTFHDLTAWPLTASTGEWGANAKRLSGYEYEITEPTSLWAGPTDSRNGELSLFRVVGEGGSASLRRFAAGRSGITGNSARYPVTGADALTGLSVLDYGSLPSAVGFHLIYGDTADRRTYVFDTAAALDVGDANVTGRAITSSAQTGVSNGDFESFALLTYGGDAGDGLPKAYVLAFRGKSLVKVTPLPIYDPVTSGSIALDAPSYADASNVYIALAEQAGDGTRTVELLAAPKGDLSSLVRVDRFEGADDVRIAVDAYRSALAPDERATCLHVVTRDAESLELTRRTAAIDVSKLDVPPTRTGLVYSGAEQWGVWPGSAYELSGACATDPGTYTATVTPKAGYTWRDGSSGPETVSWSIATREIGDGAVYASVPTQLYTGKALTPAPVITFAGARLVQGVDYAITGYASNTAIGTARITVKGLGKFSGTRTITFSIAAARKPMYRLYNPNSGEHFYTASLAERRSVIAAGWRDEGQGWVAPSYSRTPVYRLYSGTDHHYTTSKAERDYLIRAGWRPEGIGWYSDDAKGVPLYRQFNPNVVPTAPTNNSGSHNYTTSKSENDHLVSLGWRPEGIGWYGLK